MTQTQLERFVKVLEKRQEECLKVLEDEYVSVTEEAVPRVLNLFAQLDAVLSKFAYVPDEPSDTETKRAKIIPMDTVQQREENEDGSNN